ncbi:hypothetical protein T08_669 [Trichinella sp. T8]|nr:hypothetical protein T08_669 [Trichinella sp. T8]
MPSDPSFLGSTILLTRGLPRKIPVCHFRHLWSILYNEINIPTRNVNKLTLLFIPTSDRLHRIHALVRCQNYFPVVKPLYNAQFIIFGATKASPGSREVWIVWLQQSGCRLSAVLLSVRGKQSNYQKKTLYPLCFGNVSQTFITTSAAKKPTEFSTFGADLASEKWGKINRFQTIKARAFGDAGSGITVTCLLDTGAEYSFIREDVASALGVVGRAQPVKVEGFGGATHEHPSSQVVQLWLGRLDGSQNAERYPLEALTVPSLCHQIPVSKTLTSEWEHLQFLNPILDDESFDEVHVVIGKPSGPVAVEIVLGWIICGSVNPHPATKTVAAISAVVEPKVEDLLRRFWEIEGMGIPFRSESDEVELQWRVWKFELNKLHCIAIRRAYLPFSPTEASRLELHGFGDASEAAYAAVVSLRGVKTQDDVQVSFVTVNSRVAPLKKLSTPQLELMAALLCARLVCYVRKELALDVEACHRWSDNKVTVSPPQDAANVINPGRYSSFERLIRVTAWCR